MNPEKGYSRCRSDATAVNVARRAGDDATHSKSDNDRDVLQEWRTEQFGEDD